jgi:Ca2+ transporting ATPase
MENAFAKSTSEVLKFFGVSETHGLTAAQVKASREKHGRNGMYSLVFTFHSRRQLTAS